MVLGVLAFILAVIAAGWLLARSAKSSAPGGDARNMTILRGVIFLGLVAVLMAAKLWPLAFMTLLAAAAVTGIELWRAREVARDASAASTPQVIKSVMKAEEAASILGVESDANPDAVKAAHKKLISQLHPDKGGTDYLAAQINDARAVLLKRAEARSAQELQAAEGEDEASD